MSGKRSEDGTVVGPMSGAQGMEPLAQRFAQRELRQVSCKSDLHLSADRLGEGAIEAPYAAKAGRACHYSLRRVIMRPGVSL